MSTPMVSSGSDLLAGMYGSTVALEGDELGASAMAELSPRSGPEVKRDERFVARAPGALCRPAGPTPASLCPPRPLGLTAERQSRISGNVLERADVRPGALRSMRAVVVAIDRHKRRVGRIDRDAARLEVEVAVCQVDEHRVAGRVAVASKGHGRRHQVVLVRTVAADIHGSMIVEYVVGELGERGRQGENYLTP